MTVRVRQLLVLTALAATMSSGCTTATAGNATPETDPPDSTQPETPSGGIPTDGAPKVEDPLDTSRFQEDPCLSLSADQSEELNLGGSGKPAESALGGACEWRNDTTRGRVRIAFFEKSQDGLSAEYRAEKDGKWAYFDELAPIDGLPAVARDITDDRKNGGCPVVVGASDELTFEVDLQQSEANVGQRDPCEVAVDVAEMAVATMRKG
jgi:hypothetical protein